MNNLNALLRSIIENPDEDTPRLMYADELEAVPVGRVPCPRCYTSNKYKCNFCDGDGTNGDYHSMRKCVYCDGRGFNRNDCATCDNVGTVLDTSNRDRAELIRVQIEYERDRSKESLNTRARELLQDAILSVQHPKIVSSSVQPISLRWNRGFIRDIEMSVDVFLRCADDLIWHPDEMATVPMSYDERSDYACGVCGNVPDERGCIEHGRGCYTQDEDGGGTSYVYVSLTKLIPRVRPCPDLAHPIRNVTLSPWYDLDAFLIAHHFSLLNGDGQPLWSSPKWPGIVFTLPR